MGAKALVIRTLACAVIVTAICVSSQGGEFELWDVDNSSELTGYVTQDVVFDTDTDWLSAEMFLWLESGTIYQDSAGGDQFTASSRSWTPSVEFDTYIGGGKSVSSLGGATSLGGPATSQFDESALNIAWFGLSTTDIGAVEMARVTLSDDASGAWAVLAYSMEGAFLVEGVIQDGVMLFVLPSDPDPDPDPDPNSPSDPDPNSPSDPDPDPNSPVDPDPDPNSPVDPDPDPNSPLDPDPDPDPNDGGGTEPPDWVKDLVARMTGGSGGSGGLPGGLTLPPGVSGNGGSGGVTNAVQAGEWGKDRFRCRCKKHHGEKDKIRGCTCVRDCPQREDPRAKFRARRAKQRVGTYKHRIN